MKAGNYSRLSANEKTLFWSAREDSKSQLMALKITNKNPKPVKLVDEIRTYELSMDGKKALVRKKDNLIIDEIAKWSRRTRRVKANAE